MAWFAVVGILGWAALAQADDGAAVTSTHTSTHYLPWKPTETTNNGNCYCIMGESQGMYFTLSFGELSRG